MSYIVTVPELLGDQTVLHVQCLDRIYLNVILTPSAGALVADLGGSVEDAVLDAAVTGLLSSFAML